MASELEMPQTWRSLDPTMNTTTCPTSPRMPKAVSRPTLIGMDSQLITCDARVHGHDCQVAQAYLRTRREWHR